LLQFRYKILRRVTDLARMNSEKIVIGKSFVLHALPQLVDVVQLIAYPFLDGGQLVRAKVVAVHSRDDNHWPGRVQ
jgi:hypothetical protein